MKKISHAYIFIGKNLKSQALKFTRTIQKSKFDLHVLDCEKSIKIGQIRELQKQISLKPYSGKYKIAIIPEAHLMTNQAQNALLKTLEEPSGKAVLILTCESEFLLLETIISRCQIKRFHQEIPKITQTDLGENLDNLVIYYRNKLLKNQNKNYLQYLKQIIKVRNLINKTNINKKLAFDNLEISRKILNI